MQVRASCGAIVFREPRSIRCWVRSRSLSHVRGYDLDPASNVVEVCVSYLRRKLGSGRVGTVQGMGTRSTRRRSARARRDRRAHERRSWSTPGQGADRNTRNSTVRVRRPGVALTSKDAGRRGARTISDKEEVDGSSPSRPTPKPPRQRGFAVFRDGSVTARNGSPVLSREGATSPIVPAPHGEPNVCGSPMPFEAWSGPPGSRIARTPASRCTRALASAFSRDDAPSGAGLASAR